MTKKRNRVLVLFIITISALAVIVFLNLPKPLTPKDSAFDLGNISDGIYLGICDNGLVKAQVEVKVRNQQIYNVKLLEHNNGLGGDANVVVNQVVIKQSVEIESISGATISSKTILKAVENALVKGESIE